MMIVGDVTLNLGFDLCVGIERCTVLGQEVHAVVLGIVNWLKELAPVGDTTCVFRDSAFADDVAKTNIAAILNQHGIQNVRSL